jgi:hypothetical protein
VKTKDNKGFRSLEAHYIEAEYNNWIEEKEKTLIKLMHYAKPIDKIKYQAQIDFLNIVKINLKRILQEVKQ